MKKHLIIALLFFSVATSASTNTGIGKIKALTIAKDHVRVRTDNMKIAEECTKQDWYILQTTDGTNSEMYAALLSAKATQENVYLMLSGCFRSLPSINHVYLCENTNCRID